MFTKRVIARSVSFLFVAALLLAQVGPAYATNNSSATIKDSDGNPITGVSVQVCAVFKSDSTYSLSGLPLDAPLAVVARDEDPDSELTVCSTMFNFVNFAYFVARQNREWSTRAIL